MSLSVLMIVRSNIYSSPGGDTTQVLMTAKYLRKMGLNVDVKVSTDVTNVEKYNVLHFFNVIRPDDILPFINLGIPFVVSTIFVDYSEYEKINTGTIRRLLFRFLSSGQIEYIKAIARWLFNGDKIKSNYYLFKGHKASMRKIASMSQLLLPNSHSEYQRLTNYLGIDVPYRKVVNAIDDALFNSKAALAEKYKDHVLCVGRIEGRKNQLNLIKALVGSPLKLTIIGKPSPNHIKYYNECKTLAALDSNIEFIEHIDHESLVSIYKAAKVHVLPSWFETTGLSSLEAGIMECNVVVTKKGDTEEYFGDLAYYCDPDDISSIRNAVVNAFNDPVKPALKEYIASNYTWEIAANQTFNAYKAIDNKLIAINENSDIRN
ncbi:glycosyltransferase family 4 protein [Pararcticibacter amylolyticus]|uniref:Glycosyl transferase family 1 n=1 Tax=Pararcticibacter amylolyticus TaxID=2173175 RepID=A0A2U2PBI3_9SPHI|nr:glycosyltransferase family 4 protein [Pararcticibacter amylolyticus]PWG78720.1 glycosyl transferase family 1 [Pararcticibacter amylolyticus]